MKDLNDEPATPSDELMIAVAKTEVLIDDHEDAIEEFDDNQEEIGNWLTVIFKSLKEALL